MRERQRNTIIRYSCLTGKAVWLNTPPTKDAMWKAYQRARTSEFQRIRDWDEKAEQRKSNILRLLDACTVSMEKNPTPEKRDAANRLRRMAETPMVCDRAFYDHLVEELKHIRHNTNYDK